MSRAAERTAFFDGLAPRWDGFHDLPALADRLALELARLDVAAGEVVLDAGCGTGNLLAPLLARLGPSGRVIAVDPSPAMLEVARSKVDDARVAFQAARVERLPLQAGACDRAFCLALWPHLDDPAAAALELARVLRPGGLAHVWHLSSRAEVNAIHGASPGPVRLDLLGPAAVTAAVLVGAGFTVEAAEEDDRHYLVTARKPAGPGGAGAR